MSKDKSNELLNVIIKRNKEDIDLLGKIFMDIDKIKNKEIGGFLQSVVLERVTGLIEQNKQFEKMMYEEKTKHD